MSDQPVPKIVSRDLLHVGVATFAIQSHILCKFLEF